VVHHSVPLWIGHPGHDLIKDRLAGAFHTAEVQVIASLDRFEPPKQKLLLYTKLLRMNYRQIETMSAYQSPWLGGEPQHSLHGRSLR
jgi:hypothetical protein